MYVREQCRHIVRCEVYIQHNSYSSPRSNNLSHHAQADNRLSPSSVLNVLCSTLVLRLVVPDSSSLLSLPLENLSVTLDLGRFGTRFVCLHPYCRSTRHVGKSQWTNPLVEVRILCAAMHGNQFIV